MKKVFIALTCLLLGTLIVPARAQRSSDPNAGILKFKEEKHDFETVPEGPAAETDFEFKNMGKSAIVISEVTPSCKCITVVWVQDPIAPGAKGIIHVSYDTKGRPGMIMKDITIKSNAAEQTMTLHIWGTVQAQEAK